MYRIFLVYIEFIFDFQIEKARYLTIFAIAADILPVQASAVLCKHVFSSEKITLTDRHNKISRELMEALQILKFQFKKGFSLSFTHGTALDDELKEMEGLAHAQNESPKELNSYLMSLK